MKGEKLTYDIASKFILENFNLTRLGCKFFEVDYETAERTDRENARSKMNYRLKNLNSKHIDRLNSLLFPFVEIKSDQYLDKINEIVKKSR